MALPLLQPLVVGYREPCRVHIGDGRIGDVAEPLDCRVHNLLPPVAYQLLHSGVQGRVKDGD